VALDVTNDLIKGFAKKVARALVKPKGIQVYCLWDTKRCHVTAGMIQSNLGESFV
jgi:hypothetical protein